MSYLKVFSIILLISSNLLATNPISINVGIYQNEPKIFLDKKNKPSGFHVDLLNEIAKNENWKINYIQCQWSQCLDMLKKNELDIMPDVGYSKERAKQFAFSNESIFSSWSYVYSRKDVNIKSILDFQNRNIAVLKESIQQSFIKDILDEYSVVPKQFILVNTWNEAFNSILEKKADALIINRFYELNNKIDPNIIKTDVVVMPIMVKFAFSPSSKNLINPIDLQLKKMKNDESSVYYKAKEKWLIKKEELLLPYWVIWSFLIAIGIIIVLTFVILLFKKLVTKKTEELVQKEQIILMQSRHAAMGEMIGMIAHQWRQPLSIITTSASGMKVNAEFENEVTNEDIIRFSDLIMGQANYLSKTIDNFRNFLKGEKIYSKINLKEVLNNTLNLTDATIKNNKITLIEELDENLEIYGSGNELCEAFINIINNSKDALKDLEYKFIFIKSRKMENGKIELTFKDNGGGIEENIMNRIFEPYFTSKHQSVGTGLGLTMVYKIIVERHNGTISASNEEFTYENKKFKGACFTITLNSVE